MRFILRVCICLRVDYGSQPTVNVVYLIVTFQITSLYISACRLWFPANHKHCLFDYCVTNYSFLYICMWIVVPSWPCLHENVCVFCIYIFACGFKGSQQTQFALVCHVSIYAFVLSRLCQLLFVLITHLINWFIWNCCCLIISLYICNSQHLVT